LVKNAGGMPIIVIVTFDKKWDAAHYLVVITTQADPCLVVLWLSFKGNNDSHSQQHRTWGAVADSNKKK